MSRVMPVCVVRTEDHALKFFDMHEPIPAKSGGNVTLNLNLDQQTMVLHLCKRCGVAYVDSEIIKLAGPKLVPPPPDDSPTSH